MSAHDYLIQSFESIIQRSTVIIEGRILKLRSGLDKHNATIEEVTIAINEVIHGQLEDEVVLLKLTRLDYEDPNHPLFPILELAKM